MTTYHMSLDVQGALLNWKKRDFKGLFKHDDGRAMTPDEARFTLLQYLAQGKRLVACKGCNNFDHEKGCLGHPDAVCEPQNDAVKTEKK